MMPPVLDSNRLGFASVPPTKILLGTKPPLNAPPPPLAPEPTIFHEPPSPSELVIQI